MIPNPPLGDRFLREVLALYDVPVKVTVPGFTPDDIQVTLTGDTLTIKGEFKQEQEQRDDRRDVDHADARHDAAGFAFAAVATAVAAVSWKHFWKAVAARFRGD